jgi:hypothetical protein
MKGESAGAIRVAIVPGFRCKAGGALFYEFTHCEERRGSDTTIAARLAAN